MMTDAALSDELETKVPNDGHGSWDGQGGLGRGHRKGASVLANIAASLNNIDNSLHRIADKLVPPPQNIVGTEYVTEKLNCTKIWVARMAANGRIPRSCVVPGTGGGEFWKFYRSRIDEWLASR
jgi:hypothetical protein